MKGVNIFQKVLKTIQRYDMLEKGDKVIVGVSGGPDSIFLLTALNDLKKILDIEIFVATLDHGIRKEASKADLDFVKKKADSIGLDCISGSIHSVAKEKRDCKISTEEVLRKYRYKFYSQAAKNINANVIATGHTLDDQAETVLMRIITGATIKGLSGIPPVGKSRGLNVIRPLIELERKEILDFLKKNKIPYRMDHTNLQQNYFRNKVRQRILPYLARYNPKIKRSLALMAESLREDREFIEDAKKRSQVAIDSKMNDVSIRLKDVIIQPKALRREIIRDAMIKAGADIKRLTFRHWKEIDEFLKYKHKGQLLHLPGNVKIRRGVQTITFAKEG